MKDKGKGMKVDPCLPAGRDDRCQVADVGLGIEMCFVISIDKNWYLQKGNDIYLFEFGLVRDSTDSCWGNRSSGSSSLVGFGKG